MDFPSHIAKPKLCSLRKWDNYTGYGFNLHSEKGKKGQFIGKVDPNSPADLGGLKPHDVLIEVNGINIEDASHNIVVGRVKSISDRVDLFVCHDDTYKYCKENGIVLSSAMHYIDEYSTPMRQPTPEERAAELSPERPSGSLQASLQAAIDQSGGVDFEEVKPGELPEKFRSEDEPIRKRDSDTSSNRDSLPPPSFSAPVAAAAPAVVVIPAAASTSVSSPPAYEAPKKQQQQLPQQQPPPQQKKPPAAGGSKSGGDPVGNVSLEEMRGRIGQNKRNQVKMNNSTFSEKYSVFESL